MASIVALRMIKALVRLGWSVDRASGTSHHVLTKAGHQPITVPVKKGRPSPAIDERRIVAKLRFT